VSLHIAAETASKTKKRVKKKKAGLIYHQHAHPGTKTETKREERYVSSCRVESTAFDDDGMDVRWKRGACSPTSTTEEREHERGTGKRKLAVLESQSQSVVHIASPERAK
jgi:hypothetical protein